MIDNDSHIEYLTKALQCLKSYGHRVALGIFYDEAIGTTKPFRPTPKAYGFDEFYGRLSDMTFSDCATDDIEHTLYSLIAATKDIDFPIHRLEIELGEGDEFELDDEVQARRLLESVLWLRGALRPEFELSIKNVSGSELSICTNESKCVWRGSDELSSVTDYLYRFVDREYGTFLGHDVFREIRLESISLSASALCELLPSHSRILDCVELRNIVVEEDDTFTLFTVLKQIRDGLPGLKKLVCEEVVSEGELGEWRVSVSAEDTESVHKELEKLVG